MKKGFIKKALAVACAGSTIFASIAISGCKSENLSTKEGFLVLKESENIYSIHKASFSASNEGSAADEHEFESECGFKNMESKYGNGYIYNEKTSVVFGNVPYRLYKDKEEIHYSILENAEYCEECFAE